MAERAVESMVPEEDRDSEAAAAYADEVRFAQSAVHSYDDEDEACGSSQLARQLNDFEGSHKPTSSDAAVADALSCSLADIAGTMRGEGQKKQQQLSSRRAISESTRTETSSNNDGSDPDQSASTTAVTGSTSNSDSYRREETTTSPTSWPESARSYHRHHRPHTFGKPKSRERDTKVVLRAERHQNMSEHVATAADVGDTSDHERDRFPGDGLLRGNGCLVEAGKESADLNTIRRTMSRVMINRGRRDSTNDKPSKRKTTNARLKGPSREGDDGDFKMKAFKRPLHATDNGSLSGSGTEGGYAGSSSANGDNAGSYSPSVSSSDESQHNRKKQKKPLARTGAKNISESTNDPKRPMLLKTKQDSCVSSDIADFGSSSYTESFAAAFGQSTSPSSSPSITSSSDSQDDASSQSDRKLPATLWPPVPLQVSEPNKLSAAMSIQEGKAPILSIGCDIMANVLTFLEPPDIQGLLTMPLCKDWLSNFTRQPELWRVLCLLDPFKAQVEPSGNDSSDDSADFSNNVESELRLTFGKHRLLYTSFVRCMRYLSRIKDDALNGRPPSVVDNGYMPATFKNIATNQNLKQFLARARGITLGRPSDNSSDISDEEHFVTNATSKVAKGYTKLQRNAKSNQLEVLSGKGFDQVSQRKRQRDESQKSKCKKKKKRVTYGHSILTQRVLGPTADGTAGTAVELPWSCAIYSIVNWMVAFSDVEGIQTMCMKVLPHLLDDEQQRITAQRAGLTDIVFRGMVMFPDSSELHTAACHTIVLLARPLGGREGMLFHTSVVNASGIFSSENGGSESGRNGIAVLLDSMRRFRENDALQAMSCWSLVNVALAPAQKEMLVRLGAIEVTAAAMQTHPHNAEVQFRALFALVNLVIPSVSLNQEGTGPDANVAEDFSERDILDDNVGMVVELVVQSMKNFCASEAILNRACLVLHNLSLTQDYHNQLLWTPNCYQMLEWCLANYPSDQVLQQSAAGTLHRLQSTLSADESLRSRFMASLQSQQQLSLEQAHREAGALHTQIVPSPAL